MLSIVKFFVRLFFDERYLRGRYFEGLRVGWRWALRGILYQRILGFNRQVPWPVAPTNVVLGPENITFDSNDLNNFQTFGCYWQASRATITLGKGSYVAPNVGLITANHDPRDLDSHQPGLPIVIGRNCWIGMNAVVLPGCVLGDSTIVGAGSVVTKSFETGHCVIAGNPARVIREL